jgi:hypothetical protein
MDYHNLKNFKDEISYNEVSEHLKTFETKLHEFEEFLRPVDKSLYDRVRNYLMSPILPSQ